MKDDYNGRRPKWKTNKMEDDQKWKTAKMEDDKKWKTTKREDEQNLRRPKCKNRESRGYRQKRTSNLDSG